MGRYLQGSRESTVVPSKRRWPPDPRASNGGECIFGFFLHLHRTDEPCLEPEISFALEPRRSPRWWVSLPTAWRGALPGLDTRISWWTQVRFHGWLMCPKNVFQLHWSTLAQWSKLVDINCWHVSYVDVPWLWLAVVGRLTHERKYYYLDWEAKSQLLWLWFKFHFISVLNKDIILTLGNWTRAPRDQVPDMLFLGNNLGKINWMHSWLWDR